MTKVNKTAKTKKRPAPKHISQKQWWGLVFEILLLLIWVGAAVIASQLVVGYSMLWILGRETFVQTVPTAICSALSYILAFVWILFVTPILVAKIKNKSKPKERKGRTDDKLETEVMGREDLGLRGTPTWTDIGLAPVGFIVSTFLAAGFVMIFNLFPWFNASETQDLVFSVYLTGFDRVLAFIILVVVAPIAEELIFRGWLYGKLRSILSAKMSDVASMILSILLVSILFGIVHMQWNVGVNVFALSVVLCGLREITGTIYAGMLTHMIKNGIAFYMLYILG